MDKMLLTVIKRAFKGIIVVAQSIIGNRGDYIDFKRQVILVKVKFGSRCIVVAIAVIFAAYFGCDYLLMDLAGRSILSIS